jgi:cobyric acid synthase CobQ
MKTPAWLIAGTCSDAGKSVITAGLLRLASDRGIKATPFKAQNMALNGYVTADGCEIGRSQGVQAEAARIEGRWEHNPVLLKPISDTASQVIVKGKVLDDQTAREYYATHQERFKLVQEAYDTLAASHDLVLMEGAGSPAEINLWDKDLVNMPMADYADARVLLVADIDRGGSFASIYGTWSLFPEAWKKRLAGYVLNRFRGDRSFLDSGIQEMKRLSGLDCFGVIPWIPDLKLPEEDRLHRLESSGATDGGKLSIGVIRTPYMANFTDFDPFRFEPDVSLSFIHPRERLDDYDVIILPGSKNTAKDLDVLAEFDLASRLSSFKGTIVGVCGGMQMLGGELRDPDGVESADCRTTQGLGLLSVETTMDRRKTLCRRQAIDPYFGTRVYGYEIHHGQSIPADLFVGQSSCFGSYLHGLFDSDEFRHAFLADVYSRKTGGQHVFSGRYDIDAELNRFAQHLRQHMHVDRILDGV